MLRRLLTWAPAVCLAAALFLRWSDPIWLRDARFMVFANLQRLHPRAYVDVPVRIVDLDDESLAEFGQWPWPRTLFADLVQKIADQGAASIAFDIVFAEPDRTSPQHVLDYVDDPQVKEQLRPLLQSIKDHDTYFEQVLSRVPAVSGVIFTNEPTKGEPKRYAGIALAGDDPHAVIPKLFGVVLNLPGIEASVKAQGHFNLIAERDGIIRRVPLFMQKDGEFYPSLVAESLRLAQGASSYKIKAVGASGERSFGSGAGITSVKIGSFVVPTDQEGKVWLYDSGYKKQRWVSAKSILTTDAKLIPDKAIVFIGTSASGLKDLRSTPLNPVAAGVEVHAQLAEQILTGKYLYRPDWADGAEVVLVFVLGLLCVLVLPRVGAGLCALLGVGALFGVFAFSDFAFRVWHWLLDPLMPAIAVVGIYLVTSLSHYIRSEQERRQIRTAFGRYLSPALVKRLSDNPDQLKLGGESRTMTLMFSDIRGFTGISERLDAQMLTELLNRYMTPMTDAVLKAGGTVDKYMGDGLMAFWNAPLDDPQHTEHAATAALAMHRELQLLNLDLLKDRRFTAILNDGIRMGVGMTRGECCVGNLGSQQRFDYSAVGDVVNLASRLEGQAKIYGLDLIVDEQFKQNAPGFAFIELDRLRVKGKDGAVVVYALLGDSGVLQSDAFKHLQMYHDKFLHCYRNREWEEALRAVGRAQEVRFGAHSLEKLYALYTNRIHAFQVHPPAEDWDGVTVADTK